MSLMSDILSSNNPAIDTEIIEDMCSFFISYFSANFWMD